MEEKKDIIEGAVLIIEAPEGKRRYFLSELNIVLCQPTDKTKGTSENSIGYCKKIDFEVMSMGGDYFFHEWLKKEGLDANRNGTIIMGGIIEGKPVEYKIELENLFCIKISEKFNIDKENLQLSTKVTLCSTRIAKEGDAKGKKEIVKGYLKYDSLLFECNKDVAPEKLVNIPEPPPTIHPKRTVTI